MTWIDDNKGEGPWPFEKQSEKPYYNEGNLISNKNDHVWKMDFSGVPITPTHNPCGYWHNNPVVPSPSSCDGASIGYTTQYMEVDDRQTLTVEDSIEDGIYSWNIASGGGELTYPPSGGNSIYYTAPSSNANCDLNPVIELKVGETVCDTLQISIGEYVAGLIAYDIRGFCYPRPGRWTLSREQYSCWDEYWGLGYCTVYGTEAECNSQCFAGQTVDLRTEEMILQGCCPIGLM